MRAQESSIAERRPRRRLRWAGPLLAVIAVVVLCGFTLYWTQSRLEAVSTRLDGLEGGMKAVASQELLGSGGAAVPPRIPQD